MNDDVKAIIRHIPGWHQAENILIEPLAGLTNTNYAVTVNGERFVLRVSGQNTGFLGIARTLEYEVLKTVSEAGIGAELFYYSLPEGHLVTRLIEGHQLTLAEYRTPENIRRIVDTLKRLHGLPLPQATFSPFRRIEKYARHARELGVPFPADFNDMVDRAKQIEYAQARDTYPWQRFCHNDLFSVNVLDDGYIRFIDWEFSGVNDVYFDLATLTYAYDTLDTLSPELQEYVLVCYFGTVSEDNWLRLAGMQYMLLFFTAMWGLLQQGMLNQGLVQEVEGFHFLEYAEETFETMRQLS